ncbi:MAG TPA: cupin domain-containing protein [Candidatus Anaerotruncus excrementipullorum]|uniref:Cupin domain-containing protein n=1 Tax=Candidatus Anaerotruncus excrementipullorum TaxID=2838465 RepID=A0A9D2B795_9FIRM|nr:cupin domain-containing protein [Candidatus Anaerotruncus excrementipullorum]
MIIRKEEQKITVNEQMRGGEGSVQLRQLLAPEQFCGHGRLFNQLELAPGCSIGSHYHNGESETFYILQGTARFDDNGQECILHAGDVAHTPSGHFHSIANAGQEPLVLVAMIVNS